MHISSIFGMGGIKIYFAWETRNSRIGCRFSSGKSTAAGLERPIVGFNVIAQVIENQVDLCHLQRTIPDVPGKNIERLAEVIRSSSTEQMCQVKTGNHKVAVPSNTSQVLRLSVHTGVTDRNRTAIFAPKLDNSYPDGLELQETVVSVGKGSTSHIGVMLSNHYNHPLTISPRTTLVSIQRLLDEVGWQTLESRRRTHNSHYSLK